MAAPTGPFIEVPYLVHSLWLGQDYQEIVTHGGFPAEVLRRLRNPETFVGRVTGWSGYAAYCAANGRNECPSGYAWLEAAEDGKLRMHSGVWNQPRRVGRLGRWRW